MLMVTFFATRPFNPPQHIKGKIIPADQLKTYQVQAHINSFAYIQPDNNTITASHSLESKNKWLEQRHKRGLFSCELLIVQASEIFQRFFSTDKNPIYKDKGDLLSNKMPILGLRAPPYC